MSVPSPAFVKRDVFVMLVSVWVSPALTVYVSPSAVQTDASAPATAQLAESHANCLISILFPFVLYR